MFFKKINFWGKAYLLLIPFYAFIYHVFFNGDFYFSTISFENKVKKTLKENLILEFENSIDSINIYGSKSGKEALSKLYLKNKEYKVHVENFNCYEESMKDYFDFNILLVNKYYDSYFNKPIIKIKIPKAISGHLETSTNQDSRYFNTKFNDSIVIRDHKGFITFFKSNSLNTFHKDTFYTIKTDYSIFTMSDTLQGFLEYCSYFFSHDSIKSLRINFIETFINSNNKLMDKLSEYYTAIKENKSVGINNFLRMFYFSTVVITTLGFGDIVPVTDMSRIIVSSEAILGVIFIGLFLNKLASNKDNN